MANLVYSYDKPRAYCAQLGLIFDEAQLATADALFARHDMPQDAVDELVCLYAWNTNWYWKPSTYSFRQRVAIACHFLFGRA